MIAIPPTEATTLQEFRDYYAALCEVTGRPIFFQTSGGAPDVVPTVDFMVDMAREFPNLAYVKEERPPVHERMLALREHRPDPIKSIFGAAFGRQWLYEMRLGMDGVMTGGAMYADIYARLWELHVAGKQDELRDLFGKLLLMLNLDRTIPGIRLYVLKRRGDLQDVEVAARRLRVHRRPGRGDRVPPRRDPAVLPGVVWRVSPYRLMSHGSRSTHMGAAAASKYNVGMHDATENSAGAIPPPRFERIDLRRFRAFGDLSIQGLSRVNLITGRNNTGKSSVLEALRILATNAALDVICDILRYREEDGVGADGEGRSPDSESLFQVSGFFHGFPQLSEKPEPIEISATGRAGRMTVALGLDRFSEERDSAGNYRLVPLAPDLFGNTDGIAALVAKTNGKFRIHPLNRFRRYLAQARRPRASIADGESTACAFVSPYASEGTELWEPLWDRIALTDDEQDVIGALHIIDPTISAVSMIRGTSALRSRTAIVRAGNVPRPVPLRSFGDGLNRLFGLILSLVNAQGGFMLIDEFENGLHYSVQLDAWRTVFRLAQARDIQVFATSHSWDTIETFQKAAAETVAAGALIRLARKGEDIIPTVFAEDELAIATRDRIEMR